MGVSANHLSYCLRRTRDVSQPLEAKQVGTLKTAGLLKASAPVPLLFGLLLCKYEAAKEVVEIAAAQVWGLDPALRPAKDVKRQPASPLLCHVF